ncbi:MAG: transcription antitermination factor NusB [Hyphomicrobium sp.]
MTTPDPMKAAATKPKPRSTARMAAVQALYQMDLAGTDVGDVIAEFETLRFHGGASDGADGSGEASSDLAGADPTFFAEILRGVVRRQKDIDPLIDQQLATGWRMVRIDSTLRAILRAGAFELFERPDVPVRVVINEYINIAHGFFDRDEPKVANGVLDAIARRIRPQDFNDPAPGPTAKS